MTGASMPRLSAAALNSPCDIARNAPVIVLLAFVLANCLPVAKGRERGTPPGEDQTR
jgi:hypothetical protein